MCSSDLFPSHDTGGLGMGVGGEGYWRVENSGGMGIFDKKLGMW